MINSPRKQTRKFLESEGIINSKETTEKAMMHDSFIADASEVLTKVASKRNKTIGNIKQKIAAVCIGEKTQEIHKTRKLASKLRIIKSERRMRKAKLRKALLEGKGAAYAYVIQKSHG